MTRQEGAPIWIELASFDPEVSLAFYKELFGWTADDPVPGLGEYRVLRLDGRQVCGLNPGVTRDGWRVFLASPDAVATAAKVELAGGMIDQLPDQFGDFGIRADFVDPVDAWVGALQDGTHAGIEIEGVPGAPCWYELHTQDFARSARFYQEAFAWTFDVLSDTDDFRMVTFPAGAGEDTVAGIYDAARDPLSLETSWRVYFAVADADATASKVDELGGAVLTDPEDSPYGRIAHVLDPVGVPFSILRLPDRSEA